MGPQWRYESGRWHHFLDVQATPSPTEVGTAFISHNSLSSALLAHSSDTLLLCEAEASVSFGWIPGPQRADDADDLGLTDRPEVPAVERIGMGLQEEKLAGEEGETPLPGRQGAARGVMVEGLGDGLAVEENNPVRPADPIPADGRDLLEKRHAGGQQAIG